MKNLKFNLQKSKIDRRNLSFCLPHEKYLIFLQIQRNSFMNKKKMFNKMPKNIDELKNAKKKEKNCLFRLTVSH